MARKLNRGMLAALGMLACLGALVAGQEAPTIPCCGGQQQTPDAAEATPEPIPDPGPDAESKAADSICPHFVYMNMGSYCVYYSSHYNGSVCQPVSFSSTNCGHPYATCPGGNCIPPCVLAPVPCETEKDVALEEMDPGRSGYRGPMHDDIDPGDTIPGLPPGASVTVTLYDKIRFNRNGDGTGGMIFAAVFKAVIVDPNDNEITLYTGIQVKPRGGFTRVDDARITRVEGRPWAYHWDHDNNPATAGIEIIAHWKTPGHDQ